MVRILIVGCGITGAICAASIRKAFGRQCRLFLCDKARGAGGRMTTFRFADDDSSMVDIGAQYVSVTREYMQKHTSYIQELTDSKVLVPLTGITAGFKYVTGTENYAVPSGMSALVKHYLNIAGPDDVFYKKHVAAIDLDNEVWRVTHNDGTHEQFDAVILTMPVPQILQLNGTIRETIEISGVKSALSDIEYSSRFALGLFYEPGTNLKLPWMMKFFDHDVIRYIAVDSEKRQADLNTRPSLCVHMSVPFSIKHSEKNNEEMKPILMSHLEKVLPNLPEPVFVKCHKWRYSQVTKPMVGQPGSLTLHTRPPLICAGDGFFHSNFNGCLESAQKASSSLHNLLTSSG